MTAEEWLREHGVEVERASPPPGVVAKHPTAALPEEGAAPAIDEHETRRVPSVVRLDIHIGGDVAEWPTTALPGVHAPSLMPVAPEDPANLDASANAAGEDIVDVTTAPLPALPPAEDVTHLPTRRLGSENM
jgi:hypothetical protein